MTRWIALLVLVPLAAHAEPPAGDPLHRARELYQRGDFVHAREQLLAAYAHAPDPELLFALGQVEFNLGDYAAAIAYYERFLASDPTAEQAALAQQAIGAARARVVEPRPAPTIPRGTRHVWMIEDTGVVTLGAAALVVGAGLVIDGRVISTDHHGSLATYDHRIDYAHATQWTGVGIATGGVLVIAAALVHWRLHTETYELRAHASTTSASISVERTW